MATVYYYIAEMREDVDIGGEQTDLYMGHSFTDTDFSSVAHPTKVPADKMPSEFEVGDLIKAQESLAGNKLGKVETEYASADLHQKVERAYESQYQKVADYAEQLGIDVDDLPKYYQKPGIDAPKWYYYLNRREGDRFILDKVKEISLDAWGRRIVPADAIPAEFGVGDVLLSPDVSYGKFNEAEHVAHASPEIAGAVRELFTEFESRVQDHAERLDACTDVERESLKDGDVILAVDPEGRWSDLSEGEQLYVTPEGMYSSGETVDIRFEWLVDRPDSALESGMTFELVELEDDYVDALRYDHSQTQEVQDKPIFVDIVNPNPSEFIDGIDSRDDIEWPVYVVMDSFDDGQYYSGVWESGGTEDSKGSGLRKVMDASVFQP